MVRISDIITNQELINKPKPSRVSISEVLTAEDIMGERISPGLRAPTTMEEQEAKIFLDKTGQALDRAFSVVGSGKIFSIEPFEVLAEKFVNSIDKYDNIYMLQEYRDYDETDYGKNCLWTALISVKIGRRLGLEKKELCELFLAALFHDIGITQLPDGILAKKGDYSESERRQIEQHPEYGRQILLNLPEQYRYLSEAAYQEHERMDGSGYPNALSGNEISLFAKIIGLADSYEAMTHARPYRHRVLPLAATKEILEKMRGRFDLRIVKAFLEEVTMFPVGSFVRLNNREVGRVIAAMSKAHFRHVVQVLFDPNGQRLIKPKTINLMEEHLLYIAEPVDERTLV
ncbi:MAG: HD domain-containing protein [Candidatus Dadabacteria bacterium]|nr:HD domain-containing protein [Candidatus Dadabacteria bacterium]